MNSRDMRRRCYNAALAKIPVLSLILVAFIVYKSAHLRQLYNSSGRRAEIVKPLLPVEELRSSRPHKIFVYDVPSQLTLGAMLSTYKWGYCSCCQSFYGNEVDYHRHLLSSDLRTRNPEEATLFFVPVYTGCLIKGGNRIRIPQPIPPDAFFPNVSTLSTALDAAISDIRRRYPYWDRMNGKSHIWLFTQGFGAELFSAHAWGQAQNGIILSNNGQLSERRYRNGVDIAIPGKVRTGSVISIESEGPYEIFTKRSVDIYFGGTVMQDARYSGGTRQELFRLHSQGKLPSGVNVTFSSEKWVDIYSPMRNSTFCLCLEGWWAWTPRPFEAIMQGCIPVVVSDDLELPFEELLPWKEFSVKLSPSRGILEIVDHLLSIPQRDIHQLQQGLLQYWRSFSYRSGGRVYELIDVMIKKRSNERSRTVTHERRTSEWSPRKLNPLPLDTETKLTGSRIVYEILRMNR